MPHANSTTSRPRCTSPAASESTLPCSSDTTSASSSTRLFTISRNAKRIFVRADNDDCDHFSNATAARSSRVDVGRLGQQHRGLLASGSRVPDRDRARRVECCLLSVHLVGDGLHEIPFLLLQKR